MPNQIELHLVWLGPTMMDQSYFLFIWTNLILIGPSDVHLGQPILIERIDSIVIGQAHLTNLKLAQPIIFIVNAVHDFISFQLII